MARYIVTKNNPYYPSVQYCDTLWEARQQQAEWVREMRSIDGDEGRNECLVTIAEIISTEVIRSDY